MALEAGRSNAAVAGLLQPQKSCIESTFFYAQYLIRERTVGSLKEKRQRAVCIIVPDEYMGDVIGDVTSRRGNIQGLTQRNGAQQIDCFVPLSEMFGYATNLRSRTQGRGQFTMEPSHYVELNKALTEAVVSKRKGY